MKELAFFLILAYGFLLSIPLYPLDMESILVIGVLLLYEAGLLLVPVLLESGKSLSRSILVLPTLLNAFLALALLFVTVLSFYTRFFILFPQLSLIFMFVFIALWSRFGFLFLKISEDKHMPIKSTILGQSTLLAKTAIAWAFLALFLSQNKDQNLAEGFPFSLTALSVMLFSSFLLFAIALLSLGPGIYFLFAKMWKKHRHKS